MTPSGQTTSPHLFGLVQAYRRLSSNDQRLVREFVASLLEHPELDRSAKRLDADLQKLTQAHRDQLQGHASLLLQVQEVTGHD